MSFFEVSNLLTSLASENQVIADNEDLDRSATLALLRQKKATGLAGIEVIPDKDNTYYSSMYSAGIRRNPEIPAESAGINRNSGIPPDSTDSSRNFRN